MKAQSALALSALFCLAVAVPAAAQQKQQVSFASLPENNKYAQQQNVNVGDIPGHQVRVYDLRSTYPNNAPVINGVKLIESMSRGIADMIDGNGSTTQYIVFVMENGDKFFARTVNVLQSTSGKVAIINVGYITGGTGKFAAMQGIIRGTTNLDFKTGFNETQFNIEYSIGK